MCNLIKDIIGYECIYEIDTNGIVYGKERKVKKWDGERLIKKAIKTQEISREGYARVSLFKNGISKKYSVHRLVAIVFINNKENKSDVNHKDGNKLNNNINNLEWVSKSENVKHSINILKNKNGLKYYEKGNNWYREKRNLPYYSISKEIKNKIKSAVNFINDFEDNAINLAKLKSCDIAVCGHIHQPDLKENYMNSGDWCENCTALVETLDGKWEIFHFHK